MSKFQGTDGFKRDIYNKMTQNGYEQPYETFVQRNSDKNSDQIDNLYSMLLRKKIYEGNLDQFKEQFYGVKKKPVSVPSKESQEQSEQDYVNIAGVQASGSTIERANSGFQFVREGQELSAGKKEQTVAQIKEMRQERPGASIVQVKDDKGRPTLKFLEDHKEQVKTKATRVPDAAVLDNQDAKQSVEQYYQNKPDYLAMVKERKEKGYENTYNAGKFVDQGISDMQRDVRNAIDIKAKEIGKPVLSQYLNLNEQLKKTPETAREYPQLVADYQKFNQAHPDLAEYEGLVNKFWALDSKSKEARKNPAYKDYYANLDKKEQAQATADMFANIGMVNNDPTKNNPFLPAATKELYDLGTGLVRAAAGMQRWVTGSKYASLDNVVENMEQVLDPNNYSSTATPSNRTKLVGQKYADVGDFKVLFDGDKVMGVVTKDGGYKVRDQAKVDEVMAAYERDKPKIKTQAINPYTATDVIIGGATQLGLGMVSAGVGAKLGKAGSMMSNFGSKATTIATNSAGTYNKLYNSAIQELGASNQKAAERYAGLAAIGMSMIGTLVNPLEQQLLGQIQKQSIRSLAKELGEGVAEQTAVRNATRMLLTGIKTIGKEGVVEGATEALLDDAIKFGVNKTILKDESGFEIDLPQDIIDNVAEETIGGLFGSVAASLNPSTLQQEAITNAFKSPNRAQILAKLDKKAAKHYETVFAKAELTGRSPVDIHKEELVKAKTGEDYVAPAQTVPAQEEPGVAQPVETTPTQDERSAIVKDIADQIDLKPGQKITTPMGQTATIIGFDVDEADEDGEGAANNYLIRMDESGEETVVSIADYNKRVYEQGISQLQAQGMDRNEAEFAIEAARSVRGLNVGQAVSNVTESPEVEAPKDVEAVANVDTPVVGESPVVADQSGEQSVIKSTKVEPINNPALAQSKKIDGITYDRQPPIQGVTGSSGKIEFSASSPMQDFTYKVIEADQLQPSHSNSGGRNPLHFIPEAQPKERNDKAGTAASDAIADNIDFGRVSAAPNAYTGAPIVNDRGEVIQGNNRAIGIKKHYQGGKVQYKEQLIGQAQQLGIDPAQVQGMNNPVLVREVKVDDTTAIELGNYDVKDLETGGQRRIDPVATSRRIPFSEKQKVASVLLTNPDKTLRENIKDNFSKAAKLLVPKFISPNQYDTIFSNKTNNITPKGVDDITELVLHFLFDGGDIKLRQVFDMLPSALQQGIINSMPQLFSVPQGESIVEQLQNAIILLYEVDTAKSATIDEFLGQVDMFDAAKANRFSPTDIALAKLLTGKKQKEVQTLFSKYAALTLGSTDMFGTTPGVSKAKALSELTGVSYSPTPQDITNGANQNIQRNASGENSGSRGSTSPDARISDETTSSGTTASYQGAVQFVDTKSTPGRLKPLAKVVEKALKAMSKYGTFKAYFYENQGDIRQSYNERANFALNDQQSVTGFFNPDDNSIHIYVNADGASTIALHEILHPFVRAIKKANPGLFTKLYENLKTIPEYSAVTMTGNSVKGFSENPYYDFIGTTEEEALVEFFAKVGSGELILRGKSKGKVVEWINSILRAIGFNEISVDADIRKWANAIATALQQGIELEGVKGVDGIDNGVQARVDVIVDFPYYDEVAKLVELGLQKGLTGDKITKGIQNAFTAQGITADPNVINAVYQARSATFRKSKPITNKVLAKVKEIHSKLFVAMGGGKIREFSERLDGTIQRYVEQVNALISVAEKQSKGVDQDLVDRFLRDENSADEKQVIVNELRKAGFDEKNLDQYQRRGTTRFQRSAMVQEFTAANPNTTPETDAALQQFIDSKMNTTDRDKVPDNLAETLTTMRMQIDNLSQYLIDEGYVVGDRKNVIEKNLGQYMSDVYGIFKDKKFNPTKAAELKARKYFIEQIKNDPNKLAALAASGGNLDEEITKAAIKMVNDYKVKSKVSAGSFNAGTGAPVGKKSESIFKKKEGVPDELKDLLGKYNPLQEYAYTMYKLVSYVENSKFQRRLVNMGKGVFMWDKNDPARPEDANYELKGFASAKLQGDVNPLKGMMATKEVYDVLNGLDKDMFTLPPILKGFLRFQGWVNKMKTVYSYQTHFGNVIGNFFFMAFNGMLDLQTFSSINTARKATGRDFLGKYGTSTDEVEKVLTILKDEGVIGNEISIRAIRETVGRLEKSSGDSAGAQIGNKLIGADKAVTDLYQAEDSFFKILAYLTERKRYSDALYGRKYENLTPVEQEEVSRQATEIAKSNYPNYGRMGKLSQSLAKNNVIFGNFLSFTFEAVRTYGNTIGLARRELLSPNPKVKAIGAKRTAGVIAGSLAADGLLMGLGKVTGGVFGLLFSDKDDTKLNRDLRIGVPKFLKGGDLLFTPVKTGVYRVVDLSAKNPLLVFRRHFNALLYTPSDEETAKAVATQFLESFFSKPIAMKYVDSINNNDNQKDGKIWLDSDSSTERAEKIFMFTVKTIAPSSINSARKLTEADNFWVTAGNQVVGMNSYEIDYERVWGNKIRDYESLSDAYRGIRKELKTAASDDTVTDREFKEALKEYNVKRKAQMDKLLEIKASMMNIMPGKEGEKIIKGVIEESALGKDEKNYLNTGKWRDYSKSRNDLKYK